MTTQPSKPASPEPTHIGTGTPSPSRSATIGITHTICATNRIATTFTKDRGCQIFQGGTGLVVMSPPRRPSMYARLGPGH